MCAPLTPCSHSTPRALIRARARPRRGSSLPVHCGCKSRRRGGAQRPLHISARRLCVCDARDAQGGGCLEGRFFEIAFFAGEGCSKILPTRSVEAFRTRKPTRSAHHPSDQSRGGLGSRSNARRRGAQPSTLSPPAPPSHTRCLVRRAPPSPRRALCHRALSVPRARGRRETGGRAGGRGGRSGGRGARGAPPPAHHRARSCEPAACAAAHAAAEPAAQAPAAAAAALTHRRARCAGG